MITVELDADLRQGLCEIAHFAVNRAAAPLARCFSTVVHTSIPQAHRLESADVSMALASLDEVISAAALTQAFVGDGISGETLLLIDASPVELASLLDGEPASSDEQRREQLIEVASLLSGSCIRGVLAQLNVDVLIGHPVLLGRRGVVRENFPWERTLALELNYGFEGRAMRCDLLMLFHRDALPALLSKLELLR